MQMEIVFYDRSGVPVGYTEDRQHIYLYSGDPVAYLEGDSVYSYSSAHLGWFGDGWVRDHSGACVFFTDAVSGGPVRPVKQVKPVKSVKAVKPVKRVKQVRPVRSVRSLSWSSISGPQFVE